MRRCQPEPLYRYRPHTSTRASLPPDTGGDSALRAPHMLNRGQQRVQGRARSAPFRRPPLSSLVPLCIQQPSRLMFNGYLSPLPEAPSPSTVVPSYDDPTVVRARPRRPGPAGSCPPAWGGFAPPAWCATSEGRAASARQSRPPTPGNHPLGSDLTTSRRPSDSRLFPDVGKVGAWEGLPEEGRGDGPARGALLGMHGRRQLAEFGLDGHPMRRGAARVGP